jgi:hypothetical protein
MIGTDDGWSRCYNSCPGFTVRSGNAARGDLALTLSQLLTELTQGSILEVQAVATHQ